MRTRAITSVTALVALAFLAGCGGGSSAPPTGSVAAPPTTPVTTAPATTPSSAGPADVAAATAQVTTAYLTVFNPKSTKAQQEGALEDGSTLGPALKFAVKLARKTGLTLKAKVDKVAFSSPTQAAVTYDLIGTPLKGSTGQAVLVTGKWVVAKNTFCGLLTLGAPGQTIPGCTTG